MPRPRNPKNWCKKCNTFCRNSKSNLCQGCWQIRQTEIYGEKTLAEVVNHSYTKRNKFQSVRNHARRVAAAFNMVYSCYVCGYETHVELAHKKPITDFVLTATLKEVNSKENLVYLCRNHHWEQENQIICLAKSANIV